jgi:hypothetical protein
MELKKVKFFEQGSQETPCFTAQLWDNGKHVAYLENNGHGGNNMVNPAKGFTYKDVAKYDDIDVECEIFGMVYEFDDIRKNQSKGFFTKQGENYYITKFPYPISKMKKQDWYATWLQKRLDSFKRDGQTVLNRNL